MSVFHSISAFCNAGFDILGTTDHTFVSLTGYSRNIWLNIVIMLLIILGGIGFLTWEDFYTNQFKFKRYRMQSKVILITTAILIIAPAVFFFACDFGNQMCRRDRHSLLVWNAQQADLFSEIFLPLLFHQNDCI